MIVLHVAIKICTSFRHLFVYLLVFFIHFDLFLSVRERERERVRVRESDVLGSRWGGEVDGKGNS